jgi:hypothetical protein
MRRTNLIRLAGFAVGLAACAPAERRFPLRAPLWHDADLASVNARCHEEPTDEDPKHVSCAPAPYDATIYWDGADKMFFRPLSETVGLAAGGEAANVNSLDEVPDSAWFTNRLGVRPVTLDDLRVNACPRDKLLDPDTTPDGAWLIDQGKTSGSTPGFRMKVVGKGKYLVKVEAHGPERQVASTVIGEAVYWAAGYNASCEQALWVRPSIFKLKPGLRARHGNFGDLYDFDQKAVDDLFAHSTMHGGLLRVSASSWVPGYGMGQFKYEGTRDDDPNDVIPHENRRELRGARVLASWIGHVDCREGNSLDSWMADDPKGPPDASPGHVVHYQIGTSAALGNVWDWEAISRRLNYSYVVDWGDMATDFLSLGAVPRVYETVQKAPGHEIFGYWNVADFDPDRWKNEYPNPAFDRMTERDAAWMARILARFTPEMVRTLAEMGRFTDPANTAYLDGVLEGRLRKILERYLTRLSPITEVHVEGTETLCGVDLAEWRGLRDPGAFHYAARIVGRREWLPVARRAGGEVCVTLPHVEPDGSSPDDAPARYVRVRVQDGVARGPLVAHLYDLGPTRGYRLAGLVRELP